MGSRTVSEPPILLQLAGHPLRWRLLHELSWSDRRVGELVGSLGEPQSLVSYHLRRLRAAEVLRVRRSSFDGRDTYYSLDLVRCGELLGEAGASLHPGLGGIGQTEPVRRNRSRLARVLFLCTGNSARSQIAEALLHDLSGGAVEASSAGSEPKPLHPSAIRVMRKRAIDISANRSKHLDGLSRRRFDYVISLCDRVREVCPEFRGEPRTIHWSIPDPAAEPKSTTDGYPAFEHTAKELETRIRFLLHRIHAPAPTMKEVSRS